MNKLRVACIVSVFPAIPETFILNQIIDLLDRGHEVDIYAYRGDLSQLHKKVLEFKLLERVNYLEVPKSKVKRIKLAIHILFQAKTNFWPLIKTLNIFQFRKSALDLSMLIRCSKFLNKPNYDIIHAHYGPNGCLITEMKKLGFFKNTKLVTTFHGYDISPNKIAYYQKEYKSLFSKGNLFTVNSYFAERLLVKAGCPKERIFKLPVGLDTLLYKPKESFIKKEDIVRVLFCGRLISLKGPDLIIDIVKELVYNRQELNIKFYLIGDGPLRESIKQSISDNNLCAFVEMVGSKTQEEVIEIMSEMDIFLYPGITEKDTGREETQGLVIQEAQAMKLPVVVSCVGGVPEGIINNKTGFLVEKGNVKMFASLLDVLIKNKDLRTSMGEAGRDFVVENYDSKILGHLLIDKYYQLIN